jgi:hypothetical protein
MYAKLIAVVLATAVSVSCSKKPDPQVEQAARKNAEAQQLQEGFEQRRLARASAEITLGSLRRADETKITNLELEDRIRELKGSLRQNRVPIVDLQNKWNMDDFYKGAQNDTEKQMAIDQKMDTASFSAVQGPLADYLDACVAIREANASGSKDEKQVAEKQWHTSRELLIATLKEQLKIMEQKKKGNMTEQK